MSICLVKYLLKYRLITTFVTEIYKRLDYTKRTNFRVAKVKIKLKKKDILWDLDIVKLNTYDA